MDLLYQAVLSNSSFLDLLYALDLELAGKAQAEGCPICGGALHWASYWRKPRGVLAALGVAFRKRFSFCCAVRDCRKRLTPPSLRFLGRKVYLAAAVILLVARGDRRSLAVFERSRPADAGALADMVAFDLHRDLVLAGGEGRFHAAGG